jgi:outer membrane receptor protein involved in Fe transport
VKPWLVLSALAAAVGGAWAQSPPAAATPGGSAPAQAAADATDASTSVGSALQTVTVSGTRRRELIREVPLSISSVKAERLAETGARSLNDYLAMQPGVVLQNSGVADNGGSIVIRGLTAGIDSNSPTTVYLDDTPLGQGTTFDLDLLDLNRFEVLRGPQGTLYGASAMGGVVKYTTIEPDTYELAGRVGLGLSSTRNGGTNYAVRGLLNVPLKQDVAALRVALFGNRDAGYVDATGPLAGSNINKKQSQGGRLSLLVTPSKALSIKLVAMTQTRDSDGNDRISYDYATRKPAGADLAFSGLTFAEPRSAKRDLVAGTVEYDFKWAKLSSITSWQKSGDHLVTDFSAFAAAFGFAKAYVQNDLSDKRTTQEFRLVSPGGQTFDWLAGLYYNKATSSSKGLTVAFVDATNSFPLQDDMTHRDFKEMALYGNLTWNLTPELGITAGLRAANYKQTDLVQQLNATGKSISFEESPKTYLLTARYRLTPQSNVYARAASGYRPGGANFEAVDQNNLPIPGAPASYGTDKAVTYEAGYKATLGEKASVEFAVFQTDWKDLQQVTRSLLGGFTSNLGKARIRGIEAAASAEPLQDLSVGLALSLLDPKLLSDSPGLGGSAGDRLPSSPKVAVGLSTRYSFDLAGQRSYAALNANYTGNRYSSFLNSTLSPNYVMPGYLQLDLAAGTTVGKVDIGVFVRNLTDKRGVIGAATSETLAVGRTYVKVITPRTIGLNASVAF